MAASGVHDIVERFFEREDCKRSQDSTRKGRHSRLRHVTPDFGHRLLQPVPLYR